MTSVTSPDDRTRQARLRHRNAWILMAVVLALHVADEALTDFLSFYNPLVLRLRERLAWFPAPTFSFDVWIVGLALLVSVLFVLLPVIKRGGIAGYALSYALGVIMFFNGAAHVGGSLYFRHWLPGASTAPLLLIASVLLVRAGFLRRAASAGRS